MSKLPASLLAALTISLAACVEDDTPVAEPMVVPLVTAQNASVGTVTVFNSTDGLFITAAAGPGWELTESRLSVAMSLAGIPQKNGNPILGKFLLKRKGKPAAQEMRYVLPLTVDPGTELFIALQADVRRVKEKDKHKDDDDDDDDDDDSDEDNRKESAWAQGLSFPGGGAPMYLTYTVRAAAPPSLAGLFRTHSQESWGAAPQGDNAASYLSANFAGAFPGGLTIGSASGFTVLFRNEQAVLNFLPQSGTPAPLFRNWVDPRDLENPLAGSTLALALNVGFDLYDEKFSASGTLLGDLLVADPASRSFGLSVREVLSIANEILGGRADPSGMTPEEVHDTVSSINRNFEDGSNDLGFLGLP